MSRDSFESRLRNALREEAYRPPMRLDAEGLRDRLAERARKPGWIRLALPLAAALVGLAVIGVALWPSPASVLGPASPSAVPAIPREFVATSPDWPDPVTVVDESGLIDRVEVGAPDELMRQLGLGIEGIVVGNPNEDPHQLAVVFLYGSCEAGPSLLVQGAASAVRLTMLESGACEAIGIPHQLTFVLSGPVDAADVVIERATAPLASPCSEIMSALGEGRTSPLADLGFGPDDVPAVLAEHFVAWAPTCQQDASGEEATFSFRFVTFDNRPAVSFLLYRQWRPDPDERWPTAEERELLEREGVLIRIWPEFLTELRPILLGPDTPRVSAWDAFLEENRVAEEVQRLFDRTSRCTTELAGFSITITYPGSWETNPASAADQRPPACIWFGSSLIPEAGDAREAGAVLGFGSAGGPLAGAVTGRDAVVSNLTVDGREAIRFTRMGDEPSDLDLIYYVALGETRLEGPTLGAYTWGDDRAERALHRAVLDRMMQQLVIAD